ncbi:family 16 glycosylhydrolase [Pseudomonadales bacterium]|nr:family 16 glycosylhydrolase [Pseudomonadales bacterium]
MKKLSAVLILFSVITLAPVSSFAGEPVRIQIVDSVPLLDTFSRKLPVVSASASSTGEAGNASDAVDGSLSTRWESQHGIDPSVLTLDLGASYPLDQVVIVWETANAAAYRIEGSNNNSSWTVLSTFSGGTFAPRTDTTAISGTYRYVRMNGLSRPADNFYGYSIFEMEVYGVASLGVDTDNDGVDDSVDICSDTPPNTIVRINGCDVTFIGGYESPLTYSGYSLVWSDEFSGNTLNTNDWTHETGNGCPNLCGWGNSELQSYRSQNTTVADGHLTIEAKQEASGLYTSSRIKTQGKQFFKYGRIDIRAKIPRGNGLWPALWMLGESISSVGWPRSGEIDIMEMIGGSNSTTLGTAHWFNGGHNYTGGNTTIASGELADEFHVYSIIWTAQSISWYLDDDPQPFFVLDISPSELSEFRENFFFLFNIAVGGTLGGSVDNSNLPQTMVVDYIRVFQ